MGLERYRVEGNSVIIELALEEPYDLYNIHDPSPLSMRDFEEEVEKYITECVKEIPILKKIKIVFYFYKYTNEKDEAVRLEKSYKDFFKYEIDRKKNEIKRKVINGFKSLFMGLSFLFLCILSTHYLKEHNDSLVKDFFLEGLTVLGWVSLWNPVQIFLYEIWPLINDRKILERAFLADVEFKSVEKMPENRVYIQED